MGKGGKKDRKKSNNTESEKRELLYKDESQEYAIVNKLFGDSRCECQIQGTDEIVRGDIRGRLKNRVFIYPGDLVLVSRRNFGSEPVVDIIHKYFPNEYQKLITLGEITRIRDDETDMNDSGFSFEGL